MRYELIDKNLKVDRVLIADEAFVIEYLKDKAGYTYRLIPEPAYAPPPALPTIEDRLVAIEAMLSSLTEKIDIVKTDVATIKAK